MWCPEESIILYADRMVVLVENPCSDVSSLHLYLKVKKINATQNSLYVKEVVFTNHLPTHTINSV